MNRSVSGRLGVVKLKAYGEELDFERVLKGVAECVATLEQRIAQGEVSLDGPAASGRHIGDSITYMVLEVIMSRSPNSTSDSVTQSGSIRDRMEEFFSEISALTETI